MIFRNYKKPNPLRETLDEFTQGNKHISFGVIRAYCSKRLRWAASFLFKNRNNTQTNKHKAWVGFFTDKDIAINRYGSLHDIQEKFHVITDNNRTQLPANLIELRSPQYRRLGQEYTEFVDVKKVDLSYRFTNPPNKVVVNHNSGDAPAFVKAGYKIGDTDYIYQNPHDTVELFNGRVEITLADSVADLYSFPEFEVAIDAATPIVPEFSNMVHITSGELELNPVEMGYPWIGYGEINMDLAYVTSDGEGTVVTP